MPWIGGNHFVFFQPIFNIADASLSVSVVVLILFYARYLATVTGKEVNEDTAQPEGDPDENQPDQSA